MDFLGIGPLELAFILLIALIVLGPKDMVKAGKTIGRLLRGVVTSENWRTIQQASKEIRDLPNRLIREAGLEEIQNQIPEKDIISREIGLEDLTKESHKTQDNLAEWTTPPSDELPHEKRPIEESPQAETQLTEVPPEEPDQDEIDTLETESPGKSGIEKETDIKDSTK